MALKIENIIREEMNAIDGQEVLFPVVMPKELLEESGRYYSIGSELVRFSDRWEKDMVLGMTHEEAAVSFCKNNVVSYNQLPYMVYQIQTKFRDEPRCRGGLIRVREFTMKDAYSFHLTQEDLEQYYNKCHEAYLRIFSRIGLKNFIAVKSDTGMMGGDVAHEYMLLTDIGEDSLVLCSKCDYKANMEAAENIIKKEDNKENIQKLEKIDTGSAKTIEEVSQFLKAESKKTIKAVVFAVKGEDSVVIAFVRGDYEINEAKLKKLTKKNIVPCSNVSEIGLVEGNIGPIGLDKKFIIVFDKSLENSVNMVIGANETNKHYIGFSIKRDLGNVVFSDISKVREDGVCPVCGEKINIKNGVEIGNIFQLGTKYTKSMNMTVLNKDGVSVNPIMGCYGIGVGRAIASVAQESNDEKGLILPLSIAPWQVHLVSLKSEDAEVKEYTQSLYNEMKEAGIEVIYDDRVVSAGVKLADADLMGMPFRIVVSPKTISNLKIELTERKNKNTEFIDRKNIISILLKKINNG